MGNDAADWVGFGGAEDFVGSLFVVVCDGDAASELDAVFIFIWFNDNGNFEVVF